MIAHLAVHRAAGHDMPDGIEDELRDDDADNFPPSCREGHVWGEPFVAFPDAKWPIDTLRRVKCTDCEWQTSFPRVEAPTRIEAAR
jgi:hypothetical protein